METVSSSQDSSVQLERRLTQFSSRQRRVLGVLIEKAKTTPDQYPLTLNSLVAACNQKSNRSPVVNYTASDVEETLEQLRQMGVVSEVMGESGRVPRYKHHLYEWWGVNKVELAVMAEFLLRGEQTLGQLRAHVSRMEPIKDLDEMKQIVDGLIAKRLVAPLTPAGRGQLFCHTLYKDRELDELRARYSAGAHAPSGTDEQAATSPASGAGSGITSDMFAELQLEIACLRSEMAQLKDRIRALEQRVGCEPLHNESPDAP
ncbi:MAG: UPF0502 protein [Pirellulaceae bacterium]|nr:MAG: UPF0502 protein [Pirellulaceae bacterium]